LSVNGDTPLDVEGVQGTNTTQGIAGMTAIIRTLSNAGNNDIVAKYRSSDNVSVSSFNNRWLIALRFANS
jgi:hypothetical protein